MYYVETRHSRPSGLREIYAVMRTGPRGGKRFIAAYICESTARKIASDLLTASVREV